MTMAIETRCKEVNDIEQDALLDIERKYLRTAQEQWEIEKQQRYSEIEQQRELKIREAEQQAQISLKRVISLYENLPHIIRESVKPVEKIDGMKIISVEGLNNGAPVNGHSGDRKANGQSESLPEALVNSALRHRAMAPLVDSLLNEAGIDKELKKLVEE
ncbi:flotillin domain-containing protein [Marinobacterium arenosum]|uniref:flotillin domain-containing protein n=1 Tax=Marinobacterium arenosum TaxID=2862496 RepID=UPI001C9577A9|nr:flotillin domain-containing protein [Marinobacterium arenosum]MBY4678004.1 hypothetical protein [Marinobacterium arenosum]